MKFLPVLLSLCLAACSALPTPAERTRLADDLAAGRHWVPRDIQAGSFLLRAYLPDRPTPSDELTIYLEGDGLAWINSTQPAADPTPRDPLALRLAIAQPGGPVAYLARPCQHVGADTADCRQSYWTDGRFAPEVVAATNHAIERIKRDFSARRLTLVGYSGGGAVAALVAARRHDVVRLVTVAGNLDHQAWSRQHRLTPLAASLNPANVAGSLKHVAHWHLVGGRDTNITPEQTRSFLARGGLPQSAMQVVEHFDHRCCWVEAWPRLWQTARP